MSTDVLRKRYGDPKHWQKEDINEIVEFAKQIGINAQNVLSRALSRGSSKEVICAIILAVRKNQGELTQLKLATSSMVQSRAIENIITQNITPDFHPYILTQMILEGKQIPQETKPNIVAKAALKAIILKPEYMEYYKEVISDFFNDCDFDDSVKVALGSDEGMKFILSTIVPKILKDDPFAISLLQRIASDPKGQPARLVGNDLRLKCGISCFL